jgi:NADH dehydrogenase (ubiquinone) Fe-S protein 5
MSSGFGTNGGRGRCFPFWQEFAKCHVGSDSLDQCKPAFEDYQECLFHKKEFQRMQIVREEWMKKQELNKGI